MHLPTPSALRHRHAASSTPLLAIAGALAIALGLCGPIAQWAGYHAFADARPWLGVPNAANVLSNLPFALVGAMGLWALARTPLPRIDRRAWQCFCLALIVTALGSSLYHWAPRNASLVGDRLPIAWACAALLCAFLGERVDLRWSGPAALAAALAVATASVAWWWLGERHGHGDLRPYLFVQFLPMLVVPAALWMKLAPRHARAVPDSAWWSVLGLYAAAKAMELADHAVFDALGIISGHSLKHLLAAAAALCLLRARRGVGAAAPDQLR